MFDDEVKREALGMRSGDYQRLEWEHADKRRSWVRARSAAVRRAAASPRGAYELFFRHYLGLSLDQVPVIAEREDEIVWRSTNPCPTLEACRELGLETREVCRAVTEKATQAFLSELDPSLGFSRSYDRIRPAAPSCEERILRIDLEGLMGLAIDEAKLSKAEGSEGRGALVLVHGEVVARAHDTAATRTERSRHAAARDPRGLRRPRRDRPLRRHAGLELRTLPTCSALAASAYQTASVFGASLEETGRQGVARLPPSAAEVVARSPALVDVIGGVLGEECRALSL